jgi:hypothetical protein
MRLSKCENIKLKILAIAGLLFAAAFGPSCSTTSEAQRGNDGDRRFPAWRTNKFKRSVDLNDVFSGGPPKDGIPAIDPAELRPGR